MNCPKCGKQNADEAKFCIKCGSALGGGASGVNASPALAAVPEEQSILKNKFFLISLAAVFIVLAAGEISLSPQSNTPSGAVKKLVQSVEAGNYSSYRNSYSEDGLKMAGALGLDLKDVLDEAQRGIKQKEGVKKIDITKENITGDTAEVCYKIEYGNSSTEETCNNLVKEKGEWKIPF